MDADSKKIVVNVAEMTGIIGIFQVRTSDDDKLEVTSILGREG
jgi:hypothetical protein